MELNYMGIAQIQRGWSDFIRTNPGLSGCVLKSTEQWNGDIDFEVTIDGLKHTHVFSSADKERHARLRAFLVGLTDVSRQRGGETVPSQRPDVIIGPMIGRREMILDHET